MKLREAKTYRRVEFSRKRLNAVPESTGIYVLTSYFDRILYIGVSQNLRRRFSEHLQNTEKLELTPHGRVFWFYFKTCPEMESKPTEHALILDYQLKEGSLPYFNKINAPLY